MNYNKGEWYRFNPVLENYQILPPERKYVLVKGVPEDAAFPDPIMVGYLRFASGCKDSPQFIVAGSVNIKPRHIYAWNDCLPVDFEWLQDLSRTDRFFESLRIYAKGIATGNRTESAKIFQPELDYLFRESGAKVLRIPLRCTSCKREVDYDCFIPPQDVIEGRFPIRAEEACPDCTEHGGFDEPWLIYEEGDFPDEEEVKEFVDTFSKRANDIFKRIGEIEDGKALYEAYTAIARTGRHFRIIREPLPKLKSQRIAHSIMSDLADRYGTSDFFSTLETDQDREDVIKTWSKIVEELLTE